MQWVNEGERKLRFVYRVEMETGNFDLQVPEADLMERLERTRRSSKRPALKRRA